MFLTLNPPRKQAHSSAVLRVRGKPCVPVRQKYLIQTRYPTVMPDLRLNSLNRYILVKNFTRTVGNFPYKQVLHIRKKPNESFHWIENLLCGNWASTIMWQQRPFNYVDVVILQLEGVVHSSFILFVKYFYLTLIFYTSIT